MRLDTSFCRYTAGNILLSRIKSDEETGEGSALSGVYSGLAGFIATAIGIAVGIQVGIAYANMIDEPHLQVKFDAIRRDFLGKYRGKSDLLMKVIARVGISLEVVAPELLADGATISAVNILEMTARGCEFGMALAAIDKVEAGRVLHECGTVLAPYDITKRFIVEYTDSVLAAYQGSRR